MKVIRLYWVATWRPCPGLRDYQCRLLRRVFSPLQTISLLSLSTRGQPCGHTVRLLKASPLMGMFRECSPISEISLGDRSRDHSVYSPARRCMVCDTNENDINSSLVLIVLVLFSEHPVIAFRKLLTDNFLASRSTEHFESAC